MKLKKSDEKLINELALTKTVRELARVTLSYLTVEEMAKFISFMANPKSFVWCVIY